MALLEVTNLHTYFSTDAGVARAVNGVSFHIEAGETLSWEEILERVHARVAPDDLDALCGNCPWLPLGHCKDGLRH